VATAEDNIIFVLLAGHADHLGLPVLVLHALVLGIGYFPHLEYGTIHVLAFPVFKLITLLIALSFKLC
jgi:hypothetical protein